MKACLLVMALVLLHCCVAGVRSPRPLLLHRSESRALRFELVLVVCASLLLQAFRQRGDVECHCCLVGASAAVRLLRVRL